MHFKQYHATLSTHADCNINNCFIFFSVNRDELDWFLKLNFVQGTFMSFFFSSSALISFVTFMTYVLTGEILKAQTVFTCISLFNMIRIVMALHFPVALTLMNECRVSIKRMEVSDGGNCIFMCP